MKSASFKAPGLLVLAALALASCQREDTSAGQSAEQAAPDAKPGVAVADGVLMLPVVKGRPGAAYFTLSNGGPAAATLAAVTIAGTGRAELHETRGGQMAPLAPLDVKPGETARFERGGKHVMAFDLDETLKPGATAEMTLTFVGGDKVSAPLRVEAMGAAAAADHGGHD